MTQLVIQNLKTRGSFFRTPQGHFYFNKVQAPRLYPIEKDSVALSALIEDRYGLNEAERREYEHLLAGMRNEAYQRGQSVEVHRLAHYVPGTGRLYVSRFDGWVYRLDGKRIQLIHNGTDGIFFWDDPYWEPYEIVRDKTRTDLLDDLIVGSANFGEANGLHADGQRWVFRSWLLAQFFDSLHPTKPLLLVCGEKGGGKSLALRKWLKLLFGQTADVTALERMKPDGFVAAVCSLPIVVLDNVDERITWLPDHLAQLATGATFRRRKYYTTNEQVEYKPCCWLAMTSRTPKFVEERDDVLDRMLILQTKRFPDFLTEQELLHQIRVNRNRLWTELLRELNRLVSCIQSHSQQTGKVSFRMADFAAFALIVGKSQGEEEKAARILACMENRQTEMLLSEEPIYICLEEWLKDTRNHGRKVTSGDLLRELKFMAASLSSKWPYTNAHSLGQRLFHITTNLSQRFRVEVERDSANQCWYRFWPKTESLNHPESDLEAIQAPK